MSGNVYSVITSPLVTEKATLVNGAGNQVVFRVRPSANKSTIKILQ
jgi:ribosomal protein L23